MKNLVIGIIFVTFSLMTMGCYGDSTGQCPQGVCKKSYVEENPDLNPPGAGAKEEAEKKEG